MKSILVRVTAAHIAGVASAGYGPKIIKAALQDALVSGVHIFIDGCWIMLAYKGVRTYIHLPLHMIEFTVPLLRVPLLDPINFRIQLPAHLVRMRSRRPRKRPA